MIALEGWLLHCIFPPPAAAKCTQRAVEIVARAAEGAAAPGAQWVACKLPTMEAVDELMKCPPVRLILATGGPGMVRAAYSSGKPAIGVGAGNGPAYIHKSADIPKAVADIIRSKTFDNGTICASEQSIIVERPIAEQVRQEALKQGAYFLSTEEAARWPPFSSVPTAV